MATVSTKLELVDPETISGLARRSVMRRVVRIVAKRARAIAPVGERKPPFKLSTPKRPTMKQGKRTSAPRRKRAMRLNASIRTQVSRDGRTAAVAAVSRHASLVIRGTKRHDIKKAHRTLGIGGHLIGSQVIRHPGARANDFLTRAAEQSRAEVEAITNVV